MAQEFDILILGGGSAGYSAALRARQLGFTVGLVEKEKVGGTCLHTGCIPTKAYLHAAELAEDAREASKVGVNATLESIEMGKVRDYKDGIVAGKFKGLSGLLKMKGVEVIAGEGKLTAQDTVTVNGTDYKGKNIILASGSISKTFGLPIEGRVLTSTEALEMDYLPKSAIVLGGGVIGCEFASMWKAMGVDVTIIEGLPNLVPNEDPAIIKVLERAFKKRGIKFNTGTFFEKVEQDANGAKVTLADGKVFEAEIVLVAVGRGPNTANMGYEEQGIFVAEEIAGLNPTVVPDVNIPKVTFCDPEIASVGYSEPKAKEKFGEDNVEVAEYNLAGNGKSAILGATGIVKVVRQKDGPIVGVHAIGKRMGEQIGEAQMWVAWEAFPEDVAKFIHAHPTQNESLGEAAMVLNGTPLHSA